MNPTDIVDAEEVTDALTDDKVNEIGSAFEDMETRALDHDDIYSKILEDINHLSTMMRKPSEKSLLGLVKKEWSIRGSKVPFKDRLEKIFMNKILPEMGTTIFSDDVTTSTYFPFRLFLSHSETMELSERIAKEATRHNCTEADIIASLVQDESILQKKDYPRIVKKAMKYHAQIGLVLATSFGKSIFKMM